MDFQNQTFYKFLNEKLNHNGFQYKLGLNIDTVPFNPSGSCGPGGLYFTTFDHIFLFSDYGNNIAEISIPADTKVYTDPSGYNYKADRIFIKSIEKLENFFDKNPELCMKYVKQDAYALKYVQNQTPELCLAAVKQNSLALQFVQNQTQKICMTAIKQDGLTLQYVKNQTPKLCMEAVKRDGYALKYVKNQTPEICKTAVNQHELASQFVKIELAFH